MAQLALNNNKNKTTKETPFYANYGKHPNFPMSKLQGPQADKAIRAAEELRKTHKNVQDAIAKD